MIKNRRTDLENFLVASIKGWNFALKNPEKTINIILEKNKELRRSDQINQLSEIQKLIDPKIWKIPVGTILPEDYKRAVQILMASGQLEEDVPINQIYDSSLLNALKK